MADIIGALMLFLYGLPGSMTKDGHEVIEMEQSDKPKALKFATRSKWGLGLMIAGFVLQLTGTLTGYLLEDRPAKGIGK